MSDLYGCFSRLLSLTRYYVKMFLIVINEKLISPAVAMIADRTEYDAQNSYSLPLSGIDVVSNEYLYIHSLELKSASGARQLFRRLCRLNDTSCTAKVSQ